MKILTICSSPFVSLLPITQLLEKSGLQKGLNSTGNNQSYEQWHEQVFDAYEQDDSGLFTNKALSPGKVWQDMAGQLIHANLSKKQWYWSASKAGWLLDFWNTIEPQHRFVLVFSSPQIGISQSLINSKTEEIDIECVVKNWINYYVELLQFYRKHQEKCILVNLTQCLSYPAEFIALCKENLGIDVDPLSKTSPLSASTQAIEDELFLHIATNYPEVNTLFQELEASATPFSKQGDNLLSKPTDSKEQLTSAWQAYRQLKIQQNEDAEIKTKLQQDAEAQKQSLEETIKQNEEQGKENELLLIQLHQVQEELEAQFLKLKKFEDENNQEKQVLKKITHQNETNTFKQKTTELEAENELMLLQLHQVQEELEHYFLKHQELERQVQSNNIITFLEKDSKAPLHAQLIQVKQTADSLSIDLINLQWERQTWADYNLQLIKGSVVYDETVTQPAIKLPIQKNNLLPLKTWPPQTADEAGAYWIIDNDLFEAEFKHSHLHPEDIAFLNALIHQLPGWLKTVETMLQIKNNPWGEYYQIVEEMKPAVDAVFSFQKD